MNIATKDVLWIELLSDNKKWLEEKVYCYVNISRDQEVLKLISENNFNLICQLNNSLLGALRIFSGQNDLKDEIRSIQKGIENDPGNKIFDILEAEYGCLILKFFRKAYTDLLGSSDLDYENKPKAVCFIEKYFDLMDVVLFNLNRKYFVYKTNRLEQQISELKKKVTDNENLKAAFLANLSHEIRTPMNAIMGFTELILCTNPEEEELSNFLNLIRNSGKDLLTIIEDIIDISIIDSKQFKIRYKVCHPYEIMNDLFQIAGETMRKYAIQNDVELRLTVNRKDQNIVCFSDSERLKQVVSNLINNAVKFTNHGRIEFGYRKTENQNLLFFVRDTGLGIPQALKEKIFERFFQIDNPDKVTRHGTGLGLAICKNIVNLLGGEIWVESTEKEGSEFCFLTPFRDVPTNLKIPAMQELKISKANKYKWHDKHILIAEDDDISYIYLAELLSLTKAKITRAVNGLEAINLVESNKDLDLILMDIKMPEIDGFEASKYISRIRPELPIIAQTAYAMEGDKMKCLKAGCSEYVTKPIDPEKLFGLAEKFLTKAGKIPVE